MRDGMQARPASLLSVADPWFNWFQLVLPKFHIKPTGLNWITQLTDFNWDNYFNPVEFAQIPY